MRHVTTLEEPAQDALDDGAKRAVLLGEALGVNAQEPWRAAGDAAGSTRTPAVLRAGTDFYVRTFGGPRNRWGDYSGIAIDPEDQCFWVYNQHAMTRGTPTGGEDGRWATAHGKFCGEVIFADGFQNE